MTKLDGYRIDDADIPPEEKAYWAAEDHLVGSPGTVTKAVLVLVTIGLMALGIYFACKGIGE